MVEDALTTKHRLIGMIQPVNTGANQMKQTNIKRSVVQVNYLIYRDK